MNIQTIYRPFLRYSRTRWKRLFHRRLMPQSLQSLLDVVGYYGDWASTDCPCRITCLNLTLPQLSGPLPP